MFKLKIPKSAKRLCPYFRSEAVHGEWLRGTSDYCNHLARGLAFPNASPSFLALRLRCPGSSNTSSASSSHSEAATRINTRSKLADSAITQRSMYKRRHRWTSCRWSTKSDALHACYLRSLQSASPGSELSAELRTHDKLTPKVNVAMAQHNDVVSIQTRARLAAHGCPARHTRISAKQLAIAAKANRAHAPAKLEWLRCLLASSQHSAPFAWHMYTFLAQAIQPLYSQI